MNQIRRAGLADIPEMVRLKELLMADGWPWGIQVDDEWRARCRQVAVDLLSSSHYAAFVIDADHVDGEPGLADAPTGTEASSSLAACVTVAIEQHLPGPRDSGRSAYIGDMCTDIDFRGRGYGSRLLQHAMVWAREQGAGWASLFSTDTGRTVYLKAGFSPNGPFEHLSIGLDTDEHISH